MIWNKQLKLVHVTWRRYLVHISLVTSAGHLQTYRLLGRGHNQLTEVVMIAPFIIPEPSLSVKVGGTLFSVQEGTQFWIVIEKKQSEQMKRFTVSLTIPGKRRL